MFEPNIQKIVLSIMILTLWRSLFQIENYCKAWNESMRYFTDEVIDLRL